MNLGLLPIRLLAGEAAQLSREFILSRVWAAASHACGLPAGIAWLRHATRSYRRYQLAYGCRSERHSLIDMRHGVAATLAVFSRRRARSVGARIASSTSSIRVSRTFLSFLDFWEESEARPVDHRQPYKPAARFASSCIRQYEDKSTDKLFQPSVIRRIDFSWRRVRRKRWRGTERFFFKAVL